MRLDKYLKISRLIKRRTVACDACNAGRVSVNGVVRKASYEVKPDDVLEIAFGERSVKVRILSVDEVVTKDGAKEMYEQL
ncbi:MAG: RNA-binding S4 domain-containing protein [Eubacteriales bacterium]|nr:RNA-binding S4 domain-containing protein [Eubacteriales bacterium]